MPTFRSDLGSKSFGSSGGKQFEVPDESDIPEEYHEHVPAPQYSQVDVDSMNQRLAQRNLPPIDAATARAMMGTRQAQVPQPMQASEDQIIAARRAKVSGKERLTDGAKRRIEMLLGMVQADRDVDINGTKFILRTLSGEETKAVILEASAYDGTVMLPYEIRALYLSYSLKSVADMEVGLFLGDDSVEARKEFLEKLPDSILVRLYEEYRILVKEVSERYSIKSVTDAEEVSEDLKK